MPDGTAIPFSGLALRFSDGAITEAADSIGCEEPVIRAVIDVESKGGFLTDTRPKILFERHYFSRLTRKRYDGHPSGVSSAEPGGYKGGAREYDRLHAAMALDRPAALQSASWGAFQIMGANHKVAGYGDVDAFCEDMCHSEDRHLGAFVSFVRKNRLDDELRHHDWTGFARGYNGPAFRKFRYHEKLATAYRYHLDSQARADVGSVPRVLRMGDEGEDVEALQAALGIKIDGDFGPMTKKAVIKRQKASDLTPDGIVGPRTWAALGLQL